MSWWTNFRDAAESIFSDVTPIDIRGESARKQTSGITGGANKIRDAETSIFHQVTGTPTAEEKRNQQAALTSQVQAYKNQTEMTRQAINEKRNSEQVEKRRVEEKQIRSLRRNYSTQPSSGFLGGQGVSQPDMTNKLGG